METQLRNYPLTSTIIKLQTGRVQLTLIEEPDWFLDRLSRENSEGKLYLPYWTYLWESAIGLARYVETLGAQFREAHTLEIGCGFGLTGIVACQVGARVVFTDAERDALCFAQHNAEQNGVEERADFVQMDWNTPCFNRKFRYILAADVIYEEHHWEPIATLLQDYLTQTVSPSFPNPIEKTPSDFSNCSMPTGSPIKNLLILLSWKERRTSLYLHRPMREHVKSSDVNARDTMRLDGDDE